MTKNQSVSLPHCQQDPSVDGRKSCATNGNQISDTVNMEEPHKCGRNGRICVLSRRSSGHKITWNGIFGAAEKNQNGELSVQLGCHVGKNVCQVPFFFRPKVPESREAEVGNENPVGLLWNMHLTSWRGPCYASHTPALFTQVPAWQGHKQLATIWQYRQYMERCRIFLWSLRCTPHAYYCYFMTVVDHLYRNFSSWKIFAQIFRSLSWIRNIFFQDDEPPALESQEAVPELQQGLGKSFFWGGSTGTGWILIKLSDILLIEEIRLTTWDV